jgi:hypothetical protein
MPAATPARDRLLDTASELFYEPRQVARRQKRWTQAFLAQLARDAGLDDPVA